MLIGSGNPEEGRLRPQLEDRFGLSTHVTTITDVGLRTQVVRRRLRFDADAGSFVDRFAEQQRRLAERIAGARRTLESIDVDERHPRRRGSRCAEAGAVGHRGEMTLIRAPAPMRHFRSYADSRAGLRAVAPMVLRHRVPRDAFEKPTVSTARVINARDHHHRARRSMTPLPWARPAPSFLDSHQLAVCRAWRAPARSVSCSSATRGCGSGCSTPGAPGIGRDPSRATESDLTVDTDMRGAAVPSTLHRARRRGAVVPCADLLDPAVAAILDVDYILASAGNLDSVPPPSCHACRSSWD